MNYNTGSQDGASEKNAGGGRIELSLRPCKCNSVFCLKACKWRSYFKWLDKLRPVVASFKASMMLTLTVDPKRFDSPLHAWQTVGKRRWIAETIQKLHRRGFLASSRWFYVLEFQKNGWPHWHVVVESDFVPHNVLSESWGYGYSFFSQTPKFANTDHAVYYLLKYVGKNDREAPDWAKKYPGRIRLIATSRGLVPTDRKEGRKGSKQARKSKTIEERTSECEKATKVIATIPIWGGVRYAFRGAFAVPFQRAFAHLDESQVREWIKQQEQQPVEVKPFDEFNDYTEKAA